MTHKRHHEHFEESMEKLETIVNQLETGSITLEQLMSAYKEGLTYQKICQNHLDRAALILKTLDTNSAGSSSVDGNDSPNV